MSSLIPFSFESKSIRVIDVAGAPWFIAKDVALALDYVWKGTSGTIDHVPEKWRGVCSVQTPYGAQEMAALSEHGLYFFVCRSDKPKALRFQEWLAGSVLPAIRRTGEYHAPTAPASADVAQWRAQRAALWAWLIEVRPEVGKIARFRRAGLNRLEIARALGWGEKRVRLAERKLAAAGLLPSAEAQLALLEE